MSKIKTILNEMSGDPKYDSDGMLTDAEIVEHWNAEAGDPEQNLKDALQGSLEAKLAALLEKSDKQRSAIEKAAQEKACMAIEESKRVAAEHKNLPDVLHMLNTIGIAFLVGPTGTGKSTLAKAACKKLFELKEDEDPITSGKYAQISFSPDTTSGEMIGRSDVNGNFHESEIVRVFRDGGLILFDEIDDADASMLIKVNTALANGYLSTPNGMVVRNPKTYIVCAANTFGTGPDAMYVGRTRLDAATLDRFCLCTVYVDYDAQLEDSIASKLNFDDRYWLTSWTNSVRQAIKDNKLRRACSTRFVINATAHMIAGKSKKWITDTFLSGWTQSERAKIHS